MTERTKYLLLFVGGVAVGATLPIVIPAVIEGGRPLAKALLKHGSIAYQRLQVLAARAAESVEDLLAEVRAESEPAGATGATGASEVTRPTEMPDKKVLS